MPTSKPAPDAPSGAGRERGPTSPGAGMPPEPGPDRAELKAAHRRALGAERWGSGHRRREPRPSVDRGAFADRRALGDRNGGDLTVRPRPQIASGPGGGRVGRSPVSP